MSRSQERRGIQPARPRSASFRAPASHVQVAVATARGLRTGAQARLATRGPRGPASAGHVMAAIGAGRGAAGFAQAAGLGAQQAPAADRSPVPQVAQMAWGGISGMLGTEDYGSGQDSEMYLHEQKQKQQKEKQRQLRRQANAKLLQDMKYRFYNRNYRGKAALIAKIIDKKHNPPRADYGVLLFDEVISQMATIAPPPDLSPDEVCSTDNSFRTTVEEKYAQKAKETSGKTDTQIGLTADYVSYQ